MNTTENILSRRRVKPYVVSTLDMHNMGATVFQYIEIKMHQILRELTPSDFEEIVIIGQYDRNCSISDYEKDGKLTNWQRPTIEVKDRRVIVKCFPGKDYVKHYASLIASYFALKQQKYDHVVYILPTEEECWSEVYSLPLDTLEKSDAVVVGASLFDFTSESTLWQGNDQYLWATEELPNGRKVTYLIIQFSFWADILYRIVHYLAELGHKKIIFTAKLGGIDEKIIPNETLATGDVGYINGQLITWKNIFRDSKSDILLNGAHVNSPSVLYEVKDWVNLFNKFTFVDSEVGYFAKAAKEAGVDFGYLHFVSNNLSKIHEQDLSNERSREVLEKREKINQEIRRLIKEVI